MPARPTILRSILWHAALLFAFQAGLLVVTWLLWRVEASFLAWALAASLGWHAILGAFLVIRRDDFRIEGAADPLPRVNPSNTLTMARLSSIPTMVVLVLLAPRYPVLPLALPFISVMFATDFVDGIVARRRHEVTFIGRYLDSGGDYIAIIAASILFLAWRMIPSWFFALLMARLWLVAVGMGWIALRHGEVRPETTFAGKASVFAVMVLYAMEVAELAAVPVVGDPRVVAIVEYAVAAIIGISIVDKALYLARTLARRRLTPKGTRPPPRRRSEP